jgi:RNase H-like domain found in reverse transcriptase
MIDWEWSHSINNKFIKQKVNTTNKLSHPDFDKVFLLFTDARQNAIGEVFSQMLFLVEGLEKKIANTSLDVLMETEPT